MFVMALFDKRYLFKEIDRPTVDAVTDGRVRRSSGQVAVAVQRRIEVSSTGLDLTQHTCVVNRLQ